jgi:magnesium chelatase family protein
VSAASVAATLAVSLVGLEGHLVEVQTHVGRGLVAFTLVGLPDASVREARERVRAALQSCGTEVRDRHMTVNLSPAGLPKHGSGFDLAIAMSVLAANGGICAAAAADAVMLGELGLDGALRPVPGILPSLIEAAREGVRRAVVPAACVAEARLVPGIEVLGFDHLAEVVTWAGGRAERPRLLGPPGGPAEPRDIAPAQVGPSLDLVDVRGQALGRRALEVAAAGGHHLFLIGEPGAGKTMLASRLATVLPELDDQTAVEVTALHSVAGAFDPSGGLIRTPPVERPHHSATMQALIGGGGGVPRPGAVSLAHGGVLILDEAAEFPPKALDALRQPLEQGTVTIHRALATARYPAAFQLVLATNPCPCGYRDSRRGSCTCTAPQRRRYLSRLSGPLLDRIDIQVAMRAPTRADLALDRADTSARVRERVTRARRRAARRWAGTPWALNSRLPGTWIREHAPLEPSLAADLDRWVDRGRISLRGADRVLRLMWTLADLDGRDRPDDRDLGEAMTLRTGDRDERAA